MPLIFLFNSVVLLKHTFYDLITFKFIGTCFWPGIWSIFGKKIWPLEKIVYSAVIEWSGLYVGIRFHRLIAFGSLYFGWFSV